MRLDSRFLNWGLFFIVLGIIPLAVQQGWLDRELAARAWQLWPLLIIAAGVGLLLRRTTLEFLGGLIVAVTVGAMLGSVIAVGSNLADIGNVCGGGETRPFAAQQGTFGTSARVRLELNCGEVAVTTAGGSGWSVAGGTTDGQPPDISSGGEQLTVRSGQRDGFFVFGPGNRDDWSISLPTDVSLDVEASVNAGEGSFGLTDARLDRARFTVNAGALTVDLTGTAVQRVELSVNAGSAKAVLPDASLTGRMEVNAGSIEFCVPPSVGVRIRTNDNITGSNNFGERGLIRSGSTWETSNFGSATNRIDLDANVNAASISLNPEGGCR